MSNDEKANKFPCFKANEKEFEIQKRQNHYEIVLRDFDQADEEDETVNFLDAAQGLDCWKQCKSNNGNVFAGYVKIKVETSNKSDQILVKYEKFLLELYGMDNIFVEDTGYSSIHLRRLQQYRIYIFTVIVGNVPTQEDIENLLNDCVTLNTYSDYFTNKTGLKDIQIVCGVECYDSCFKMSLNCKKDIVEKQVQFIGALAIDEVVKINTSAEKDLKDIDPQNGFYPYDYTFTNLKNNLGKYI